MKKTKITKEIIYTTIALSYYKVAFANGPTGNDRDLTPALDFMGRALNMVWILAHAGFLYMVLQAAYKFSMARGDPKGIWGARDTLTQAIFGYVILLLFYTIIRVVVGYFGIDAGFLDPLGSAKSAIGGLVNEINSFWSSF